MTQPRPETIEREKDKLSYPPPFQDLRVLALHVSMGESTIENLVRIGKFPHPRMIGGKRLWSWKEVERFLLDPDHNVTSIGQGGVREATKRISQGG
jgi:hypothetical protein